MSVNEVTLVGNLGNPPEMKSTNDGKTIAKFSIATHWTPTQAGGGKGEKVTTWHRCAAFGWVGDELAAAQKGEEILVRGRLETRSFTRADGSAGEATEVIATLAKRLVRAPRQDVQQGASGAPAQGSPQGASTQGGGQGGGWPPRGQGGTQGPPQGNGPQGSQGGFGTPGAGGAPW